MPWFKITSTVPSYAKKWGLTESDQKVVWADSEFQARRIGTSLTGVPPSAIRASNSTLPGAMIRGELGADPSNYGYTRLGPAPDRGAFSGQAQETGERAPDIGALRPPDATKAHGEMIGAIDPGLAGFKDVISSMPTGLADDFNVDLSGLDTDLSRERFNPDRSGDLDAVETFESQALSEEAKAEADAIATNKLLSGPIRSWEDRVKDIKTIGPVGARTVALPPDMFRVNRSNPIKEKELQQVFKRLANLEGSDNYDQVVGSFMVRARRHYAANPPSGQEKHWMQKGLDDGSYRFSDEYKNLRSSTYDTTFGKREEAVSEEAGGIGDPQGFEAFDPEAEAAERAEAQAKRDAMLVAEAAADAANAEAEAAADAGALDADAMLMGMAGDATGPTGPTGVVDPTAAPGIGTFGEGLGAGGAGLGVTDVTGVGIDPRIDPTFTAAPPVQSFTEFAAPTGQPGGMVDDRGLFEISPTAGYRRAFGNVFGEGFGRRGPIGGYLQGLQDPLTAAFQGGAIRNLLNPQPGLGLGAGDAEGMALPGQSFQNFLSQAQQAEGGLGSVWNQALQDVNTFRGMQQADIPVAAQQYFAPQSVQDVGQAARLMGAAQRARYSPLVSGMFRPQSYEDLYGDYVLQEQDRAQLGQQAMPQNFYDFAASRFGL